MADRFDLLQFPRHTTKHLSNSMTWYEYRRQRRQQMDSMALHFSLSSDVQVLVLYEIKLRTRLRPAAWSSVHTRVFASLGQQFSHNRTKNGRVINWCMLWSTDPTFRDG